LHESGLVPLRLAPEQQRRLLDHGLGITNLASRATASAAELTAEDYARGRAVLLAKLGRYRPRAVAFVGIGAFREFSRSAGAVTVGQSGRSPAPAQLAVGEQPERLGAARLFVLPNPSGRNAHYRYADLLRVFRELARGLGRGGKT
jgi:double-stranded uracil-DNA glycosylase